MPAAQDVVRRQIMAAGCCFAALATGSSLQHSKVLKLHKVTMVLRRTLPKKVGACVRASMLRKRLSYSLAYSILKWP